MFKKISFLILILGIGWIFYIFWLVKSVSLPTRILYSLVYLVFLWEAKDWSSLDINISTFSLLIGFWFFWFHVRFSLTWSILISVVVTYLHILMLAKRNRAEN
ncbi:MAG: hypothetical protein Q8M92_02185, partial [Candidatus Subteraquimicrobiales bacterium]|nr:hypothetical protein [Candidatus Subteraquimicrobiales bacterium]